MPGNGFFLYSPRNNFLHLGAKVEFALNNFNSNIKLKLSLKVPMFTFSFFNCNAIMYISIYKFFAYEVMVLQNVELKNKELNPYVQEVVQYN